MRRALSLLASGALASLGCKSLYEDAKKPIPDPQFEYAEHGRVQFDDIPVPAGFQLQTERLESFTFERGSFRIGELLYDGQAPAATIASYYRERLPQHGWSVEGETQIEKGNSLLFVKGRTQAKIEITRGRVRTGQTRIHVLVGPRPAIYTLPKTEVGSK
jgi:hypothetical protein